MAYEVDISMQPARSLAAVLIRARLDNIGLMVGPALDQVYARFGGHARERMGQNVIFYPRGGNLMSPAGAAIHVGVEMKVPFEDQGAVTHAQTPAGRAAHVVHFGPYGQLGLAHGALHQFCAGQGHQLTGASWEVYGDMDADPSKLRTDIYYQIAS